MKPGVSQVGEFLDVGRPPSFALALPCKRRSMAVVWGVIEARSHNQGGAGCRCDSREPDIGRDVAARRIRAGLARNMAVGL